MDLIKWQNVIVEWVNCLKLCKPIKTIDELKNEEFLMKLLLLLTSKESDTENDVSIIDFLKKHYPANCLEEEPVNIQDNTEICNICSLLLHYCCLIDAREEFILPCKELSSASQLYLKLFLEELQFSCEITRDLLNELITNIHTNLSTPSKSSKQSLNSPTLCRSPLIEFLKTPLKKQQNVELHKKEVKSLQTQLDLERFEKADIQEELNLQYEKNKKLDQIISDKQAEIRLLRSQLLSSEKGSPPSCKKTDGRMESRRLKQEIASLEKYITTLHTEQEELQIIKDKESEKLRKVEEKCSEWQEKVLQLERQVCNLSQENYTQQQELITLREKYEELSLIFQEMNSKSKCDESYEIDHNSDFIHNKSGSVIDYDNLAHTVVDVQLNEAQEEIKNLKKQISDFQVNSAELIKQAEQLQCEIKKMMNENQALEKNNDEFCKQALDFKNKFEESKELLKISENEKVHLRKCIDDTKTKLYESVHNLEICKIKAEDLDIKLKTLTEKSTNLNELLKMKCTDFDNILSEKEKLQNTIDSLNNDLQNCLIKFEEQIKDNLKDDYLNCDNILKLQIFINALQDKIIHDSQNILELQDNCKLFTEKIAKLNDDETNYRSEIKNLQTDLHDVKSKIEVFEDNITKKNNIIENYKQTIEDQTKKICYLSQYVEELNKVKYDLSSCVSSLQSELAEERRLKQIVDKEFQDIKDELLKKETNITALENEKVDLESRINLLNASIKAEKTNKDELNEKCIKLQNIIIDVEEQINVLKIDKTNLDKKLEDIKAEIKLNKKLTSEKDNYIKNLKFEKQILSENIDKLNNELEFAEVTNESLKIKLNDMTNVIEQKNVHITNLKTEKDDLRKQLKFLETELKKEKVETNELNVILNEKNEMIRDLENENINFNKKIEELQETLVFKGKESSAKIEKYEMENQKLTNKINELSKIFNKLNIEIVTLYSIMTNEDIVAHNEINHNDKIEETIEYLKCNIPILINEKQILKEEAATLKRISKKLQEENKKYILNEESHRKEMNDVQNSLSQTQLSFEELIKKNSNDVENYHKTLDEYKEQNHNLKDETNQLKEVKHKMSSDLLAMKTELEETILNYETSLEGQQVIKQEYESSLMQSNKKLQKMYETFNEFQKKHSETEMELEKYVSELKDQKKFSQDLEHIISNLKFQIADLEEKINVLTDEKECFIIRYNELQEELTKERKNNQCTLEKEIVNRKKNKELKDKLSKLKLDYQEKLQEFNSREVEWTVKMKTLNNNLEMLEKDRLDLEVKHSGLMEEMDKKISNLKQEHEKILDKSNYKIQKLSNSLEECQQNLSKMENEIRQLLSQQESLEKIKKDQEDLSREEISKLRNSYSSILSDNSRLQLECSVLTKTVEDRNQQLSSLTLTKEAYEKLLEENNKLNMELDTLRYKRNRDKEEFQKIMADGNKTIESRRMQEIHNEYDEKLKKMKEKMVKLYREEADKHKKEVIAVKDDYEKAQSTIASLKSQLWITGNKYVNMKKEFEKLNQQLRKTEHFEEDFRFSRESISSLKERKPIREIEERRIATLPRDLKTVPTQMIEECVTISRKRRSITAVPSDFDQGLVMEDEEGEVFNNTYLADLKAGRCIVPSSSTRLSELQFRNSLRPPHLKSSYPVETQFTTPERMRDDEIKMGNVELDDSMTSSLLPGERHRTKKDWGQTLYKKPGPPTPSKNGGRLSLQGSETQSRDVLREQHDNRQSRNTSTPNRFMTLFSRSGAKTDNENVPTPRRNKRLSIFRR